MSEAILYAIDAPQVKSADAAADFVEEWQDSQDAPSARIATFFVRLLQTWPEDGSKGVVWHEDFKHNRPAGSMLAMTFELSEFDVERLQHLRAIAKHHGVHVFDPEGHVLYLADGSEAGVPAMAVPAPGAPIQCKSGVRFDGVYEENLIKPGDGALDWLKRLFDRKGWDQDVVSSRSITPMPKIGLGYGLWAGLGYTVSGGVATPTIGDACECKE